MRRTTMTLAGALMLSACFGAPQVEVSPDMTSALPGVSPVQDVALVTASGDGSNDAPGIDTDGQPDDASGEGVEELDTADDTDADEPNDDPMEEDESEETDEPNDDPAGEANAKPTDAEAARFLMQAAFGVTDAEIEQITTAGYERWIEQQASLPARSLTQRANQIAELRYKHAADLFWESAVDGDDQLRQRVAFALGQIVVASTMDTEFIHRTDSFLVYADILQRHAFGNYEDLIREVSLTPAMGLYLSHLGNQKADPELGTAADENFARELMQLFTIGLVELTPGGEPTGVPTYGASDVAELARVFTGFNYANTRWGHRPNRADAMKPMVGDPARHDADEKVFLGHSVPAGLTPEQSVDDALTHLLSHPNVAPFVTRQLIQRLVTSNPTPAYVARVARAYEQGRFEGEDVSFGTGRRGDMQAVIAAILLDEEARTPAASTSYGKVRSPLLRFAHFARTFRDDEGTSWQGEPTGSGRMRWADQPRVLGQRAFGAPSVFGYNRPGYTAPGTWTAGAGLAAPEMAQAAGASMIGYVNVMRAHIEEHDTPPFFAPDYSNLLSLADDPEALVDRIDLLTTAGTMEGATRQRIVDAVTHLSTQPRHGTPERRIHLALMMAVTTPEYSVQR